MIEELKIVAEMLKGVSDSAIYGLIAYLCFSYLKPVSITAIVAYATTKVTKIIFNRPNKVIAFEDKSEDS